MDAAIVMTGQALFVAHRFVYFSSIFVVMGTIVMVCKTWMIAILVIEASYTPVISAATDPERIHPNIVSILLNVHSDRQGYLLNPCLIPFVLAVFFQAVYLFPEWRVLECVLCA